jgi:hypothetical protein
VRERRILLELRTETDRWSSVGSKGLVERPAGVWPVGGYDRPISPVTRVRKNEPLTDSRREWDLAVAVRVEVLARVDGDTGRRRIAEEWVLWCRGALGR